MRRGFGSAADAARRLGVPYGTYSGHESGSRGIKDAELRQYAQSFRVSIAWLAHGVGSIDDAGSTSALPIVGIAGLGEEIEWTEQGDMHLGEVEVSGITTADGLMALECRGDSMRPRVNDRELIVARRRDGKTPADLIGREAIVKVRNGPVLLKRIRRGYEPGRYNLESYNADLRESVEIEWVAELVSIIPEGAWRKT